jgi:hypothetical protein
MVLPAITFMIGHCNNGMVASQYRVKRSVLGVVDDQAGCEIDRSIPLRL